MIGRRALAMAGAALGVLPLLGGCVAAAIPVLAASGVVGSRLKDRDQPGRDAAVQRGQPRVAIDLSPPAGTSMPAGANAAPAQAGYTRSYMLADGTRMEVMSGSASAPVASAPQDAPPEPAQSLAASTPGVKPVARVPGIYIAQDGTQVRVVSGDLPPPSGAGIAPPGFAGYDPLYAFTASVGTLPIAGSDRRSAMLSGSGTLSPETRACSTHPAALLIDLDPGSAVFDPATAIHADAKLAGTLASLRAEGVAIAWISANTADRAGAVRRALT